MPGQVGGVARERPGMPPWMLLLADKIIGLLLLTCLGALIYLVYSLLAGDITFYPYNPAASLSRTGQLQHLALPLAARHQLWSNVTLATQLLLIGGGLGGLLALAKNHSDDNVLVLMGIGCGISLLGMPIAIRVLMEQNYLPANKLSTFTADAFLTLGKLLLTYLVIRLGIGLVLRIIRGPTRAPEAMTKRPHPIPKHTVRGRRGSAFSPCWHLSECQEFLRDLCPSYLQRVSCWRRKSGCLCDRALTKRMLESLDRRIRNLKPEQSRAPGLARQSLSHFHSSPQSFTCPQCPIYREHQDLKYRVSSWLAFPATAALVFLSYAQLHKGYLWAVSALERMAGSMSVVPGQNQEAAVVKSVIQYNLEWVVIACLGLILVSYLLKAFEFAIFDLNW